MSQVRHLRSKIPQVALILPTAGKTCRELLHGILKYVHLHGPWTMHIIHGREGEQKLYHLMEWGCTGIIGHFDDQKFLRSILDAKIPVIISHPESNAVMRDNADLPLSYIKCDNLQVGRHAAEYFIERKYCQFAFVGEVNEASWSEERRDAFCQCLAHNGFSCSVYPKLSGIARKDFSIEQARLSSWLEKLEKPVAILAANDHRGHQVIDSCLRVGIAVPQECAVLGVDNDELFCGTTNPQMSSIQLNTEQAGFEAAQILDEMMRGRNSVKLRSKIITYGFTHLVTRYSTDMVQIPDRMVTRAIEFIQINTGSGVTVKDLVRHLRISRRLLETRFKTVMGRTVYAEILRLRLDRVKAMLLETTMSLEMIANSLGFTSASHLINTFRKNIGVTPAVFRKHARKGGQIEIPLNHK